MLFAKRIQPAPARDAKQSLERAPRVVDPRVNHLAVARAAAGTEGVGCLQDQHLAPGQGEGTGYGQADYAGTNNHDIDVFHGSEFSIICVLAGAPAD